MAQYVGFSLLLAFRLRTLQTRSIRFAAAAGKTPLFPDQDREMFKTLERLGIPPGLTATNPTTALYGGLAAASIWNGVKELDRGDAIAAGKSFDSVTSFLAGQDPNRWNNVLAASHFLKGKALLAQGLQGDARSEFEIALTHQPQYHLAQDALQILKG